MSKIFKGFLVAALWFPALSLILCVVFDNYLLFILSTITIPATLLIALPSYIIYSRKRKVTLLACLTFGLLISGVALALATFVFNVTLNEVKIFIIIGLISSGLFFLVGIFKNKNINHAALRIK